MAEKNSKKTTRRTTSAIWTVFAELKNPLSPKLADNPAFEDELTLNLTFIDGTVSVFKLVLEIIWNK